MRKLIVLVIAMIAAACGASDSQVMTVKTAHYKGDKVAMFAAMQQAVADKHKIHSADPATMTVKTKIHWFSQEGESLMAEADEGDVRNLHDRALSVVLVASLVPSGDEWIVEVHPLYQRFFRGRPNTDVLREDDPSIPGWAHDKIDGLAVSIHDALKPFEVQSLPAAPGATAPTGAPPPAQPDQPAAPPPAAPGGGY
jgi:hypothetical protein|nr:hypothetical protein [Kofleriaceae bacterium]